MFNLVYNIDFEVAALFFTVILYIETLVHYPGHTKKNNIFRILTIMVILTEVFDLATAYTNTYGAQFPPAINYALNCGYFMSGLFLCFLFHYYIENAVVPESGKKVLTRVNKVILAVMELSVALDGVTGWFFYFSPEGEYMHGPLYLVLHTASCWFVLCASATLIANRKLLTQAQFTSSFVFVLFYFASVLVQTFLLPSVLIIMPIVSAMLIITIFTLESPDFIQLQRTLQQLTETQQQLEAANQKYYDLAYTDLMTGLKNRTAYSTLLEQLETDANGKDTMFLIADVNNLKHLNDGYGHLAGDNAIIKAAQLIKESFANGCRCYRIGGDEFAVISDGISPEEFERCFEIFTKKAEEAGKAAEHPFSIATGYCRRGSGSITEALRRADECMYKNKAEYKKTAR